VIRFYYDPGKKRKDKLRSIYESFDGSLAEFRKHAVCEKGCNFRCTRMGNVDIVTLEGVMILARVERMEEGLRKEAADRIARNRAEKEEGKKPACPRFRMMEAHVGSMRSGPSAAHSSIL
jgi:hypothetical protein